jgi:hypothetical protein
MSNSNAGRAIQFSIGLLAFLAPTASLRAENPTVLDRTVAEFRIPRVLEPCAIHQVVQQLGRTAQIPVGFQAGPECQTTSDVPRVSGQWLVDRRLPSTADALDMSGMTARQVLDRVMKLFPDYSWKEMNGVAVVRPRNAWADPADVLNVRAEPFHVDNGRLTSTVHRLLGRPDGFEAPDKAINAQVFSLSFAGGTLLEGLVAIVRAAGAGGWDAITIHSPTSWQLPGPALVIAVRAAGPPQGPAMVAIASVPKLSAVR